MTSATVTKPQPDCSGVFAKIPMSDSHCEKIGARRSDHDAESLWNRSTCYREPNITGEPPGPRVWKTLRFSMPCDLRGSRAAESRDLGRARSFVSTHPISIAIHVEHGLAKAFDGVDRGRDYVDELAKPNR